MTLTVEFEPIGRRGEFTQDNSLLECAHRIGVDLIALCGGHGNCEHCKVQVINGETSKITVDEENLLSKKEIEHGYRLACQTYPIGNLKLIVPLESLSTPQRTQLEGREIHVKPEGILRSLNVQVEKPALTEPHADEQLFWRALDEKFNVTSGKFDLVVQRELPGKLKELGWALSVALRRDEVVGIGPPGTIWYGVAVDLGTTKLAAYLVDLATGETMASKGVMNPQISMGEDIVTRITAANQAESKRKELHDVLVNSLHRLMTDLCHEIGIENTQVVELVAVGNTVMHHFFLGLPVRQLGELPYIPAVLGAVDIKAREIGLNTAPGAYIHLLPNIGGYVGADHIAMLLASDFHKRSGVVLGLDIGTNTEICLNHHGELTSLSCASGPAFEGAHIKHGMRAATGAIEHVRFNDGELLLQTVGESEPIGICGSGLLDVISELRRLGIIDKGGRLGEHRNVIQDAGIKEFLLVAADQKNSRNSVSISQKDIRELQLAKAAIRVGIRTLVELNNLRESDIDQVIIAGAFGSYINISSAIRIGMLPDLPLERFDQIGNAAGSGARMALISSQKRLEAQEIANKVRYFDLATLPDFQTKFTQATVLDNKLD